MAVRSVPASYNDPLIMARVTRRRPLAGAGKAAAGAPESPLRAAAAGPLPNIGARIAAQKLESIDLEVRAHEAAHLAAAGTAAGGGASFDYVIGPNGERYAVGGSVRVVAQPVYGDPEATIRKAEALIRAAYAVSLPSAADMRVAAEAYQMEMDAKRELEDKTTGSTWFGTESIPDHVWTA